MRSLVCARSKSRLRSTPYVGEFSVGRASRRDLDLLKSGAARLCPETGRPGAASAGRRSSLAVRGGDGSWLAGAATTQALVMPTSVRVAHPGNRHKLQRPTSNLTRQHD